MSHKILLIEDDATTADYIVKGLVEEGFVVDRAEDGRDGLFMATERTHDAIILDRMLPGMDGMAVLAAMRAASITTPVIILSALGGADDRVLGLTGGSDDYLAKPFAFAELLARLRIVIRRRAGAEERETRLSCHDLEVDLLSRKVKRGGRSIELQPREFRLLDYLLRHKGEVVTRTMLLEGVWDYHFDPGTNVIDVHISRLRRKIDEEGEMPLIHTVRGAGYRLSEQG
ncbi:response regulator transcription factor [Sphingobium sp. BYY-5]|uniref:winged helix-turn-helix domain-containing protein n=1 Tax=Sphingobium sp. BYY-5 TaxID=2926400 RepID=UPI001FA6C40A|nr:response regulator transcription factor [Sphingobium sp. BYY-5]MCI4591786.1 response regulator transcription factor [Sphingobium sp. BYY-5]